MHQLFISKFLDLIFSSGYDSDFTLILPSCKVIICLHKLSPIPEPDVLVVKKGTNCFISPKAPLYIIDDEQIEIYIYKQVQR